MRVLVSTIAVIANVLIVMIVLVAILGQTLLSRRADPTPPYVFAIEAVLIGVATLNSIAVLAGARAFRPKPPVDQVVSTFN